MMTPPRRRTPAMRAEYRQFVKAVNTAAEPILVLLQGHLFTEHLLERLLALGLRRGDRILEHARLTYAQKLTVVHGLDILNDSVVTSLRQLNALRNKCAHELGRDVYNADIHLLGNPLGQRFYEFKAQIHNNPRKLHAAIISYLCGYLAGIVSALERKSRKPKSAAVASQDRAQLRP